MIISLKTNQNPYNLMRSCGYYYQGADSKTGQLSFIRSITGSDYPRFHAYVKKENREVIINLHLDQKKPIYKGAPAHAGEYSGPVVEKEVERIKQILSLTNWNNYLSENPWRDYKFSNLKENRKLKKSLIKMIEAFLFSVLMIL